MAVFKSYVAVDFRTLDLWNIYKAGGSFSNMTANGYHLQFFDNTYIDVKGFGFVYYADRIDILDGTTTQIEYFANGVQQRFLSGINITLAHESTYFDLNNPQYILTDVFSGSDKIYGSSKNDYLKGFASDDLLNGSFGADTLDGGLGNDTFIVDNVEDKVIELKNQGIDVVRSTVDFTLAGQHIENLTLLGTKSINAIGNSLSNVLIGNSAANSINGGSGNDLLIGGLGRDVLSGGAGADTFQFKTLADSKAGISARDQIKDYTVGVDHIDLRGIQAIDGATSNKAFAFLGYDAFTKHAGELHAVRSSGSTIIEGDVDGDAKADFQILLKDVVAGLQSSDFLL